MQPQDLRGLTWPENEAAVHHLSTVNAHDDLHPAIGNFPGDRANTDDSQQRREPRHNKVKAQVDELRNQVARLRLEIRELRVEPQQCSARIWKLMGQFWVELRSLAEIHPKANTSLTGLRDQIQRSLDEMGPKQASYDEKEDDLNFLEYQLGNKEMRMYNLESRIERGSAATLSNPSSQSSSQKSRRTTSHFTDDESSLVHRYLSRVGDANIVSERLMDLKLERDHAVMGFPLDRPRAEFLAELDVEYADQLERLREIDEDIQKLKPGLGYLSLDDVSIRTAAGEHTNPRITPLRAQSDELEGIVHGRVRRRKSDGDLVHLSFDRRSSRQSIGRWLSGSSNTSSLDRGQYHAIFDNADLDDESWWRLVQDWWRTGQTAGLLRSSPGERPIFSASTTSRDLRGQRPSLAFTHPSAEFDNFSNYPVDPRGPDQTAAPDISWKSRAGSNYLDIPLSIRSTFFEEGFSIHDGSEGSLRL